MGLFGIRRNGLSNPMGFSKFDGIFKFEGISNTRGFFKFDGLLKIETRKLGPPDDLQWQSDVIAIISGN